MRLVDQPLGRTLSNIRPHGIIENYNFVSIYQHHALKRSEFKAALKNVILIINYQVINTSNSRDVYKCERQSNIQGFVYNFG